VTHAQIQIRLELAALSNSTGDDDGAIILTTMSIIVYAMYMNMVSTLYVRYSQRTFQPFNGLV
jgi:hypothetical protein